MFVSRSVPNYLGNLASLSVSFASNHMVNQDTNMLQNTHHPVVQTIHMEITQFAALLHGYLFKAYRIHNMPPV